MASRKRLRDWGRPPGRSAEVRAAVAEAPKQVPGRKDTRRWCHGKEGREHVPQIVCHGLYGRVCQWAERWISDGGIHWHCEHRETCAGCGKVIREGWQLAAAECPAYPGSPDQRAAAEAEAARARQWWEDRRRQARRPVDGPQGYRRRRKVEA